MFLEKAYGVAFLKHGSAVNFKGGGVGPPGPACMPMTAALPRYVAVHVSLPQYIADFLYLMHTYFPSQSFSLYVCMLLY